MFEDGAPQFLVLRARDKRRSHLGRCEGPPVRRQREGGRKFSQTFSEKKLTASSETPENKMVSQETTDEGCAGPEKQREPSTRSLTVCP